jgi:hypothetical protein|tara:strand:- start:5096 stop:8734 length:3639 start_codon:yes stop_codon:yes gene_type:complete
MSKSKYPNKLDTSVEIPTVRDNITEIGSDVLNSMRSAIFQVERTLGINPHGVSGSTISSRLSKSLDESGNLKKDALDKAGAIYGNIINENVSKGAAIRESKLKLDFPTSLLQDEIAILSTKVTNYILAIEELNALISAHTHRDATGRHYAKAINVEESDLESSTIATMSLEADSLQSTFETIYNGHINFSPSFDPSEINNSHSASQIFYDNSENESLVTRNSVQGAIDDLVDIEGVGLRNSNLAFNSNGILRTAALYDPYEGGGAGSLLVKAADASYTGPTGASTETISFLTSQQKLGSISAFDILTLSGSINDDDNTDYLISSVIYDGEKVKSVEVFGGPKGSYAAGIIAKITKNIYNVSNENGLNACVRARYLESNIPDIQLANPNSATIISVGMQPSKITASARYIDIKIDGGGAVTLDLYNSDFENQNIDSIVYMINKTAVQSRLNVMAYKIRSLNSYELAITHNVPNMADDVKERTIEVTSSSSSDAIAVVGLSYIKDKKIEGSHGNAFHINGSLHKDFGSVQKFIHSSVELNKNQRTIDLHSGSWLLHGVREGDLAIVSGSSNSDDDGTYRIDIVEKTRITLEDVGYTFQGDLEDTSATLMIFRTCAHVGDMEFEDATVSSGSILFDAFITDSRDILFSKRLDINGNFRSPTFSAAVTDVSKNFIKSGQAAVLTVTGGTGVKPYATLKDPSGSSGESVFIGATGKYRVYASDGLEFVYMDVKGSGELSTTTSVSITGHNELDRSVFTICRGSYSTHLGRVLGDANSSIGIPALVDKRATGTIDDTVISEDFIERYIQGPRNDLRGSGVIKGLLSSDLTDKGSDGFTIDIGAGVAIVNGIRYEVVGISDMSVLYTGSVYIAMNSLGEIVSEQEIDDPNGSLEPDGTIMKISPFSYQNVAHICYVNSSNDSIVDLRKITRKSDNNSDRQIIVSNDINSGHFTSIKNAVAYAKMGYKINPSLGIPKIYIREGVYTISDQILIDFDLHISGSGPNTILKKTGSISSGGLTSFDAATALFVIGGGVNSSSAYINKGVTMESFCYETSTNLSTSSGRSAAIVVTQKINYTSSTSETYSPSAIFRFSNIHFNGLSGISRSAVEGAPYEYAIFIGRQNSSTLTETDNIKLGNIVVDSCMFNYMGDERGPIYLATSSTTPNNNLNNIIATGNISLNTSPNLSSISGHNIDDVGIFSDEGSATKTNVIQSGNAINA